jgi:hypothetical protein
MKKQLRNLAISFSVVALLVVGIVVWVYVVSPKLGSASDSSSTETSSTASIIVYKKTSTDISQLHVKNAKAEFTIRQKSGVFSLDGISTALLNQDTLSTDITTVADIEATRVIENNAKDLSKYGLANPKTVLDVTCKGKTTTVNVGNDTPTSSGTYISLKGSNKVYLANSTIGSSFLATKTDFVNLSIYALDSSNLNKLTRIEFGGSSRKEQIILDETAASKTTAVSSGSTAEYTMSAPCAYPVNTDTISTITSDLESLSADSALSLDVSQKSLEKYGLVNPKYTVSLTYNKKTTRLLFGTGFSESGTAYLPVMVEGTPAIYKVDASTVPFYDYQLSNLSSTLLYIPNIGDIKSMQFTVAGKTYILNITGSSDSISGTVNGKKVKESNIKNFYESAIGVTTEGLFQQAANGKLYAKIVYTYRNAKTSPVTVEFKQIDNRRCTFTINGRTDFYTLTSTVDTAIARMKTLAAGKTVSNS